MENKMSNNTSFTSGSLNKTKTEKKRKIICKIQFLVILTFLPIWSTYECFAEQTQQRGLRSILQQDPPIQLTAHEPNATQLKASTQIPKNLFISKSNDQSISSKAKSTNNEQNSATFALTATMTTTSMTPTTITKSSTKYNELSTRPADIDNTWIESILINVESLNLNHDSDQESSNVDSLSNSDEDSLETNTSGPSVSLSQVPTDSGEDPLEATTAFSSSNLSNQQHANATQYSIESSLLASSTDTNDNNNNDNDDSRFLPAASTTTAIDMESNNVSALSIDNQIIPSARNSFPAPESTPTQAPKQPISCEQAYTQCALRKVCAPALKAHNDDCQDLINNRTNQCSPKCLKAMIALRSSEEGDDLANCDCQLNEYCAQSKQRSQACRPQVELAVNPKTIVSCSTASWICMADQLCSTALEYYYRFCQTLFSQRHCSMRCNNSLSILYRQPKASKLINCHCDGSEEFPCVKYKTYTERLCLNKPSQPSDFIDDDHLSKEDTFDLTNDPEPLILGSPSASSSSFVNNRDSDGSFGDDDDDGAADNLDKRTIVAKSQKAGAGSIGRAEDSSSSDPNGIQVVEDSWIHLISGRYFTNLYEQQQKANRAQKPSHQQDFPQQQTRKGKPLKRNMEWTRNRRRISSSSSPAYAYRPWESWLQSFLITIWPVFVYLSSSIVSNRLLLL